MTRVDHWTSDIRWPTALGVFLILASVTAAYAPAVHGGFLWDDDALVTQSELIQGPHGLYRIWCTADAIDYWPVSNSSFWLEWRLWGMNPTGYHVTNLML